MKDTLTRNDGFTKYLSQCAIGPWFGRSDLLRSLTTWSACAQLGFMVIVRRGITVRVIARPLLPPSG